MAEFTLDNFVSFLRSRMYAYFPYEAQAIKQKKHKNRLLHIRVVAMDVASISRFENSISFDIGNSFAEENYPYYHILEDAEVIRKRGRDTKTSRGSEYSKTPVDRDYGRIIARTTKKGNTSYSQEYRKNRRGKRSLIESSQRIITDYSGNRMVINRESNYYKNEHYMYIERMMNNHILDELANEFNLSRRRTQLSSLAEDFLLQDTMSGDSIMQMLENSGAESKMLGGE